MTTSSMKSHPFLRLRRGAAVAVAATIAAGTLGLVACGDEKSVTHEEFFQSACKKIEEIKLDSAFEQFFADHPEATLDDWAGFLPEVVTEMDKLVAVTDLPHPKSDEAKVTALKSAITKVRNNFSVSLDAAKAGDQEAFDQAVEQNQSVDVPAMEAAMSTLDSRDCPGVA